MVNTIVLFAEVDMVLTCEECGKEVAVENYDGEHIFCCQRCEDKSIEDDNQLVHDLNEILFFGFGQGETACR